jgi:cobalt/nickel transport system permease protein
MLAEPFAHGASLLHRLDPRLRVASATAFSIVVALSFSFPVLIAALAAAAVLVALGRLDAGQLLKRLLVVNGFVLLIWAILPLTFPGEVAAVWGPLRFYKPGIVLSAQITLKSNAIVLALVALIATMPFSTLGHSLHRLGLPDKLVFLLLMGYRYVFVIEQEYHRLLRAAKMRGFRPATNRHTYRTFAYMVGMLFVRSSDRGEQVYNAMRCRGFKQKFYSLVEFHASAADGVFGALMAALLVSLIYMEWLSK